MTPADLLRLADLLGAMRHSGRVVPLGAAEALLRIAAGVDSVPALAAAMGRDGVPLPASSCCRLVSLLRGRSRLERGRWVESPMGALIVVREHPHQRGLQLLLGADGRNLIRSHLSTLGTQTCTSDEQNPPA